MSDIDQFTIFCQIDQDGPDTQVDAEAPNSRSLRRWTQIQVDTLLEGDKRSCDAALREALIAGRIEKMKGV